MKNRNRTPELNTSPGKIIIVTSIHKKSFGQGTLISFLFIFFSMTALTGVILLLSTLVGKSEASIHKTVAENILSSRSQRIIENITISGKNNPVNSSNNLFLSTALRQEILALAQLIDEKKFSEAEIRLRGLNSGESSDLKQLEGLIHLNLGREKEALLCFEEALKKDKWLGISSKAISLSLTGEKLVNCKKFEKARPLLEEALMLERENIRALINLGHLYRESGNKIRALFYYTQALRYGDTSCADLVSELLEE